MLSVGLVWSTLIGVAAYMICRLWWLIRLRQKDARIFPLFWLWVPLWLLFQNLIKPWQLGDAPMQLAEWMIAAAVALDFFYYFIIVAPEKLKQQYLVLGSGLLIAVPLQLDLFRSRDTWFLHVPHQGTALVWTEPWSSPQRYWFMQPDSSAAPVENLYDDPNYGKAIYAPADGVAVGMRPDGFFEMDVVRDDGKRLRLALGPCVDGSVSFQTGDRIVAHRPIGLLARPASETQVPGLELQVPTDVTIRFVNVKASRLIPMRHNQAALDRNDQVTSTASNRFSLR